jgi:hypothetical protein
MIAVVAPPRIVAGLTIALGVALAIWTASRASDLPPPLGFTLLGTAALEIALGFGLLRRDRASWAFALALAGVLTLTLLLALPAILRGGVSVAVGTVALVGVAAQLALLVAARERF